MELEPWMRGTHPELDALRRGVVHALELALEDAEHWCAGLNDEQMFLRREGVPPVAFHLRHAVRSLDRLLAYAERAVDGGEGPVLTTAQIEALASEMAPGNAAQVMAEFRQGVAAAMLRVGAFSPADYEEPRGVGRKRLPTTVGGLLVHCAEHTSRHIGQAVTTAKLARVWAEQPAV